MIQNILVVKCNFCKKKIYKETDDVGRGDAAYIRIDENSIMLNGPKGDAFFGEVDLCSTKCLSAYVQEQSDIAEIQIKGDK